MTEKVLSTIKSVNAGTYIEKMWYTAEEELGALLFNFFFHSQSSAEFKLILNDTVLAVIHTGKEQSTEKSYPFSVKLNQGDRLIIYMGNKDASAEQKLFASMICITQQKGI